jgi:hypothetical protein
MKVLDKAGGVCRAHGSEMRSTSRSDVGQHRLLDHERRQRDAVAEPVVEGEVVYDIRHRSTP